MREIDEVRITLLRLFRGAVRLPEEIIDEMLKAFLHTQDAAIKVQAYGRGLLQRFRYHSLITKDFNMQANREWGLFLNEVQYRGEGWRTRFARHVAYEITEDFDGQSAIMGGNTPPQGIEVGAVGVVLFYGVLMAGMMGLIPSRWITV